VYAHRTEAGSGTSRGRDRSPTWPTTRPGRPASPTTRLGRPSHFS